MSADNIVLGDEIPLEQAKLVYASGMARSVKLACVEVLLHEHLEKNRYIPDDLLRGKRLKVTRKDMMQNLGELFSLRAHVNLQSEMLDLPDYCWSSVVMERYFEIISRNLDVLPRIAIFNKKLDYANQIAELLRTHLSEQHTLKLEWCIIILIAIEIFVSLSSNLGLFDMFHQ